MIQPSRASVPVGAVINPNAFPGLLGMPEFGINDNTLPQISLGAACQNNFTCMPVPNSLCVEGKCQCLPNFYEDPAAPGMCRLAPGYSEECASNSINTKVIPCREPFICNGTNMCDCPAGYIQENFVCVKDCPPGDVPVVPIGNECLPARQLGGECDHDEQCQQSYSQCLHKKCQCIAGASQRDGNCVPVSQCPLGDPATDGNGGVKECKLDEAGACPDDHYCLYPEFADSKGFCCPRIKMNCPIGKPLDGRNCTDCPWATHHCFSYVIGTYTETMCCPNACPTSQSLQVDGQCYSRVAFGGNCMVDEQCSNVIGAKCRADDEEKTRCLCPEGNFSNYFGKCIKVAKLGDNCTRDEECQAGTNTVCRQNTCQCYLGYMPEPAPAGSNTAEFIAQQCIAEPSCPTASGIRKIDGAYQDCSDSADSCNDKEFCRKWWYDAPTNRTYSLCCPAPGLKEYQSVCAPFSMSLILANKLGSAERNTDADADGRPMRCDLAPYVPATLFDSVNGTEPEARVCPTGSSCVFDPFTVNEGVCCRSRQETIVAQTEPKTVPADGRQSTNAGRYV
uniref:EB domain-containing protein n=1 Tax=Plectus sambesii TaxID=2011161 RepID=A0A914UY82_9BILA